MFTRRKLIKAGLLSLPAFQYAASAGAARSSPANSNGSGSPPTPPFGLSFLFRRSRSP